ncbi:uncharacterized protein [Malus domestica]|uniref:uncharacterized protein n=1 Tax=Malus domestica TaxID=3750 RepID=UPI003974C3B1
MFFDGSARADGAGAGVVFMSPQRQILPYSFQLSELCSNNVAEYQALIIGLQMAINMEITTLEVYGDSKLIISQLLTEYEVRKDDLVPYFRLATQLLQKFEAVTLEHVPRKENQMADALANLASSMTLGEDEAADVPVCQRWVIPLTTEMLLDDTNVISVLPVDVEEWRQPLIDYLEYGKLPNDPRHRSEIRRRAPRFLYYKETLYRRSFEGVLLRCLGEEEANQAMEEAHSGVCGAHQSGPKLHFQLKRMVKTSDEHDEHRRDRLQGDGVEEAAPLFVQHRAHHTADEKSTSQQRNRTVQLRFRAAANKTGLHVVQ